MAHPVVPLKMDSETILLSIRRKQPESELMLAPRDSLHPKRKTALAMHPPLLEVPFVGTAIAP